MIFSIDSTSDISKNGFEVLLNRFEGQDEDPVEIEDQINTGQKVDLNKDVQI
jgi:hypothetical protein